MATSLELQFIDESYQKLVQISGSYIADGTGSQINNLTLTASFANNAISSSYSNNSTSASYAVSSSHSANSDNAISSSYAVSASHAVNSDIAISASHAVNSDNAVSASYSQNAGAAVSASHALNADNSISSSHAISASFAVTASHLIGTVTSASYAVSASHANYANSAGTANFVTGSNVFGPLGSNSILSASFAISSSYSERTGTAGDAEDLIVGIKNTSGHTIIKGTPVHAVGVTGENIDIITASNFNGDMPALGVAQADINASAAGRAVVSGRLIGFNTNGFIAGDNVYVGLDGALTQTKPTGSALIQNIGIIGKVDSTDGEMVVLGAGRTNDVPNIAENYLWLGNSDGVATAVISSSIKVDDAISSSYAVSSSYATLADNLTSGNKSHAGSINQTVAAPVANTQTNFVTTTGVTFNGNSYPISEFAYVNFPSFGDQFTNAYGISQYDGFGYTGGAELLIAPQRVQFNLTPKGAAAPGVYNLSGVMAMQSSSLGNGSQVLCYGTEVQLGAFRGVTISLGNRSGIATNQTENLNINAVTSSMTTDYNYNTAQIGHFTTGGSRGNVAAITNAGSGNNSFLSLNQGNFYTLDLTTSDTILALNTFDVVASYGQTFSILVDNSTTTNALTFDSNFKFAGGTAPTITQNGTDILTGIVYGNNNVYITAVQNLS